MKNKLVFFVILHVSFLGKAQTIEKFSIDNGGTSVATGNIHMLYTIGEINVQELDAGTLAISEGFINANSKVQIRPQVFLQGPLLNPVTSGLMNDNLRIAGYIPTTSPYADAANCNATVFNTSGNNAIVDWIWIELRAANDNTKLINARSALMQRDGDVVDLDGVSTVIMQASPTNYYVVVKHRNHLGTMSANLFGLNESISTVVDFKSNMVTTYGSNARVELNSGAMALWAGDTDGSNKIKFSGANNSVNVIKDAVLADPSNGFNSVTFASTGYLLIDINLNGQGKFSGSGNDSNIIKDNVLSHPQNGFSSPTYTISATIPPNN